MQTPAPGGGTSAAVPFTVSPLGLTVKTVPVAANDIVWEPVSQQIYLSLAGSTWTSGDRIQSLDPTTGNLGDSIPVGFYTNRLAVSVNSKYLHVGVEGGLRSVNLPGLTLGPVTLLNTTVALPFAMQIAPAPNSDNTVAIAQGTYYSSPPGVGGVGIYDIGSSQGVPRATQMCGQFPPQTGNCLTAAGALGQNPTSVAWNSDGSQLYAYGGDAGDFNAYLAAIDSDGFESVTAYPIPAWDLPSVMLSSPRVYYATHYDPTTNQLFGDDGIVLNASDMSVTAVLDNIGVVVPDGKLGALFLVNSGPFGPITPSLYAYDIQTHNLIAVAPLPTVIGTPVTLIRWGSDGLALLTQGDPADAPTGAIYILEGPFIGNPKVNASTQASKPQN